MNNAELERRLNNLIRLGTITRVDVENAVCDIKTHANEVIERPWLALRTGTTKHWNPPTVGEHVILFSPCGELAQAIVLTGLYTIDSPAPSQSADEEITEYPDGSTLSYNHQTHHMDVTLCEGATININAPSKITIASAATDITTELTVNGNSTFNGTMTVSDAVTLQSTLDVTGAATLLADLNVTGNATAADFIAGLITLLSHVHPLDIPEGKTTQGIPG